MIDEGNVWLINQILDFENKKINEIKKIEFQK